MKISRVLAAVAIASAVAVGAQAQSLGEQARENRASKPEVQQNKVFTNDNLPTGGGITVVGVPEAPPPAAPKAKAAVSATPANAAADSSAEDAAKAADKIKADVQKQKEEISRLERELDIATREWKLRQAAYYADAGNQLRDPKAWADAERHYNDETAQKQQGLADAKQKLDDLQESGRKAGLPSSAVE
jgi:hypothetical protein